MACTPGEKASDLALSHAIMARHGCPPGCAKWYLPVTIVVAAGVGVATPGANRPEHDFRGVRVFIPAEFATDVLVRDVTVANQSQYVAAGDIAGELFVADAVDGMVCFQPTFSTNNYEITLVNRVAGGFTVNAAILGYVKI